LVLFFCKKCVIVDTRTIFLMRCLAASGIAAGGRIGAKARGRARARVRARQNLTCVSVFLLGRRARRVGETAPHCRRTRGKEQLPAQVGGENVCKGFARQRQHRAKTGAGCSRFFRRRLHLERRREDETARKDSEQSTVSAVHSRVLVPDHDHTQSTPAAASVSDACTYLLAWRARWRE
jgi:hypothetical protein